MHEWIHCYWLQLCIWGLWTQLDPPQLLPTTSVFANTLALIPQKTLAHTLTHLSWPLETFPSTSGLKTRVADTRVASNTVVASRMLWATSGIGTFIHIWWVEMKARVKVEEAVRTEHCKQENHSACSPADVPRPTLHPAISRLSHSF